MHDWSVICRPVGVNPSEKNKNEGGLIVLVTNGDDEHEVVRVAFARRNSRNRDVPFEDQLQEELAKAEQVAGVINELDAELADRRDEAYQSARKQIREIIGRKTKPA